MTDKTELPGGYTVRAIAGREDWLFIFGPADEMVAKFVSDKSARDFAAALRPAVSPDIGALIGELEMCAGRYRVALIRGRECSTEKHARDAARAALEQAIAGQTKALRQIKRICATAGAPGQLVVPAALSRIMRLCRDAGIVESGVEVPDVTSESAGIDTICTSLASMIIEWIDGRVSPDSWKEGLPIIIKARLDRFLLDIPVPPAPQPVVDDWQPLSEAPQDGTPYLIASIEGTGPTIGAFEGGYHRIVSNRHKVVGAGKWFFQPLPAPPRAELSSQDESHG